MLHLKWSLVVPAVAGACAVVLALSPSAASQEGPAKDTRSKAELVEHGAYLTTLMGCQDCHTPGFFYGAPDVRRQLSGSELGWQGPWGVTYAANLTPDPDTGLGRWTDEQVKTAIRTGLRPDKSIIRPPMPWQNYAKLHDEDVDAIVAYLRSIPPVKHQEPKALPPGAEALGPVFSLPPPPAWDAPRTATAGTK